MMKLSQTNGLIISIFLFWGCCNTDIPQRREVENIKAFARLYGYVRWFHPSDEAQQIDWDRFACYGVKTVENAHGSEALKDSLLKLFLPIAPSLEIYGGSEMKDFDVSKITPPDTAGFYPVYWQHYGVGIKQTTINVYSSLRINRINQRDLTNSCAVFKIIDASKYQGKSIEISFDGKSLEGSRGGVSFDAIKSIRPYDFLKIQDLFLSVIITGANLDSEVMLISMIL